MLAIIATHPIQYHVPLWQLLAKRGTVPFEVWYLSEHGARKSRDRDFGKVFSWDLDMLAGYPHRFLKTPSGATPNTPLRLRSSEPFVRLFDDHKVTSVLVLGWQVAAYWQAVWAANKSDRQVWLRGESNNMAPTPFWKKAVKRQFLGSLFRRVDHFLCIGTANRELYRSYDVPEPKLHMARYAVDNERFHSQANAVRDHRSEIRSQWRILEKAFVVLFCGKFIPKKRPFDLIKAAQLLLESHPKVNLHLLFVGSGELGAEMRAACNVVFDADATPTSDLRPLTPETRPRASFAGFLNQTEISKAYVAAGVLVLPSDYGETWGLVVNEAMASGLSCIISDRCGCEADLGVSKGNSVYQCGCEKDLALEIVKCTFEGRKPVSQPPSLEETVDVARSLFCKLRLAENPEL